MFAYSDEQIVAIESPFNKNLVVVASPGSGKTSVLIARLERYLSTHPKNEAKTLALSFTVKSAEEIRTRLEQKLGRKSDVVATNLHAYGSKLLRQLLTNFPNLSKHYTKRFQILGESEQKKLITQIAKSVLNKAIDSDDMGAQLENAVRLVTQHLDTGVLDTFNQKDAFVQICIKSHQLYVEKKRLRNLMDFSDLINLPANFIENSIEAAEFIQSTVKCIMIDEYQDIDKAQVRLLTLLGRHAHTTVVGDSDQTIFAYRGASPDFLNNYAEKNNATLILMKTNFRSTTYITDGAHYLIVKNQNRVDRRMRCFNRNTDVDFVDLIECKDDVEEAENIAFSVKEKIDNGVSANEIAVLFRTNRQAEVIHDALSHLGINTSVARAKSFLNTPIVRTITAYLKMASNEYNTTSLSDVCAVPAKGLGPSFIEKIIAATDTIEDNVHKVLSNRSEQGSLVLFSQLKHIQENLESHDLKGAIEYIADQCGVLAHYNKSNGKVDVNYSHISNLKEYIDEISAQGGIDQLLESLALGTFSSDVGKDKVSLLTIHASKGLEFDVVYFAGFNKHYYPHPLSDDIEEERRLGYVAMTRARKKLHLCVAKNKRERSSFNRYISPVAVNDFDATFIF